MINIWKCNNNKNTYAHISSVIDVDADDFRQDSVDVDLNGDELHFAAILIARLPEGLRRSVAQTRQHRSATGNLQLSTFRHVRQHQNMTDHLFLHLIFNKKSKKKQKKKRQ